MQNYEDQVAKAVNGGQDVLYSVTPTYSGSRTVPTGFTITAYGTNSDGTPGLNIEKNVPNVLKGRNLGAFNDQNTGAPVPTGSIP